MSDLLDRDAAIRAYDTLRPWLRHRPECAFIGNVEYNCTCGLDAAILQVKALPLAAPAAPIDEMLDPPPVGTGHTSPIPPQGEWRLVLQQQGEPHPGEWVETNHPAVVDAMGAADVCQEQGCQFLYRPAAPVAPTAPPSTMTWRLMSEPPPTGRIVLMFAVTDVALDGRVLNWNKATGYVGADGVITWDGNRITKSYQHMPTHWQFLPAGPNGEHSVSDDALWPLPAPPPDDRQA